MIQKFWYWILLTDWFAQKNVDNINVLLTIYITVTKQVRSITDKSVPLQSGSVFYQQTKQAATAAV